MERGATAERPVWRSGRRSGARAGCAFPIDIGWRMCFSVRASAQSALFRRMRLSSPGQTRRRLTKKRILGVGPHGKVHSGVGASRKSALWVV